MTRFTVVSSMKNECPYILEFISHYLSIGFNDVLILTNDNEDESLKLLSLLKAAGVCDYISHTVPPRKVPQRNAFRLARVWLDANAFGNYVYVADADEFLMIKNDQPISEYVEGLPEPLAISFNWKFFGSDGHAARPPGLVLDNYRHRAADSLREHRTLKSMFRLNADLEGFSAHFPTHRGAETVTYHYADGTPYPARLTQVKPHQDWSEVHFEPACIHHYGIKSYEEFTTKKARGRGAMSAAADLPRHTDDYFRKFDNRDILDPPSTAHIARVRDKMEAIFTAADLGRAFDRGYLGL